MDATTFPISLTYHIVFCAVACIFFVIQYVRTKKSYQLLLAIGIPASLFIYIKPDNSSLFYTVGVFETIILIGALIFAIIERNRRKQEIEDTTPLPDISEKHTDSENIQPEQPEENSEKASEENPKNSEEPESEENSNGKNE